MKRRHRIRHLIFDLFLIVISVVFLVGGASFIWVANLKIPDLNAFETRRVSQSTKIYDRTGEILLYDVHNNVRRTVVPYAEISHQVKNATVAVEDAEFYEHRGIRPLSFIRALFANIGSFGYAQGGSTITQQVVKNALLTTEKKVSRKLKEWILAIKIERVLSKEEILAHYLNETPYGGNVYGIEEASREFFNKKASNVTLAEAAYLAALPQAPTFYSPYGNNREALEKRKNFILQKMLEKKFITQEDYSGAYAEKVVFAPQEAYGIKAPHFVLYIKEYLEEKYGKSVVDDGGLRVITTLDYNLQTKAEEMVKRFALENKKKFNAENAALVALDPKTGQILAMVGSRDYFDKEIDGNYNVALGKRQPGSSFKPFVYATAFKKGYTPETVVFDVKTEFSTLCTHQGEPFTPGNEKACYMPENYDHIYRGPVSLKNALAQSINVPAIKALYLAGIQSSLETARDFGITSLSDIDHYGLTLVLGGGEVSLLEMTGAYGVFATGGVRNPTQGILAIETSLGAPLESFTQNSTRVIDEQIALQISDILSDNDARAPAFGQQSFLYVPNHDVAVKTGTTNDYRDAWIVGYSPNLVVGAWAGNNDNSPMEKKVAGFIIAPLWNEFITTALKDMPVERFQKPATENSAELRPFLRGIWQGNETYTVDTLSGKLATQYTPPELQSEKVVREVHSILHWVDKKNPRGPKPIDPTQDSQYRLWEPPVRAWATERGLFDESTTVVPTIADDIHLPSLSPQLTVSGVPLNPVPEVEKITVSVNAVGAFPLQKVEFFVNGKYAGTSNRVPFTYSFVPKYLEGVRLENELRVIGYDSVQNKGEKVVPFTVQFAD
jgi:1A family penicillin-binding protein